MAMRKFYAPLGSFIRSKSLRVAAALALVGMASQVHATETPFFSYTPGTAGALGTLAVDWAGLGTLLLGLLVAGIGALIGLYLIPIGIRMVKRVVAYFSR